MPVTANQRRLLLILIAVSCVLWFWMLAALPLMHPDEGRYAEIPREMVATGDWVTPRLNGLLYFEKPAMQYWLSAIAYKIFGESEFSARLPAGLAGFLCIVLVYLSARRLWGESAARYSAVVCGSMIWMQAFAHTLTLDMTLTFFLTLALCGFLVAQADDSSEDEQRYAMWTVWAAMAGAMLTKGLVGILIPGSTLFLYSLLTRHWATWGRMRWITGLLLFSALTVPWFVVVSLRNPGFAEFFFVHEHFQRFLTDEAKRTGPIWYFIPSLLLGSLPWTLLLPRALREAWTAAPGRFQPGRLLLVWCGFVFVFFSVSSSKLAPYILPMFPALAMMIGYTLSTSEPRRLRWHLLLPVVVWVIPIALKFALPGTLDSITQHLDRDANIPPEKFLMFFHQLLATSTVLILLSIACFIALTRQHKVAGITCAALAGLICANVLLYVIHVAPANSRSSKELVKVVQPQLAPDTPLFSVNYYEQTMPFYLKRTITLVGYSGELGYGEEHEPDRWIPERSQFAERWKSLPKAAAVMKPDTYHKFIEDKLPMRVIHQDSSRVFVVKP